MPCLEIRLSFGEWSLGDSGLVRAVGPLFGRDNPNPGVGALGLSVFRSFGLEGVVGAVEAPHQPGPDAAFRLNHPQAAPAGGSISAL